MQNSIAAWQEDSNSWTSLWQEKGILVACLHESTAKGTTKRRKGREGVIMFERARLITCSTMHAVCQGFGRCSAAILMPTPTKSSKFCHSQLMLLFHWNLVMQKQSCRNHSTSFKFPICCYTDMLLPAFSNAHWIFPICFKMWLIEVEWWKNCMPLSPFLSLSRPLFFLTLWLWPWSARRRPLLTRPLESRTD